MQNTLTTQQIKSLEDIIYNVLMSNPDMDMGEMGNCREEAENTVTRWMKENNIKEFN